MNPIVFATRYPVTTVMLVVALISGGLRVNNKMRIDLFRSLNTRNIFGLESTSMSLEQVESLLIGRLDLPFIPGTDMVGQAIAQVVAMADRAMSWMPKGTLIHP
jgi:hypothetical protein